MQLQMTKYQHSQPSEPAAGSGSPTHPSKLAETPFLNNHDLEPEFQYKKIAKQSAAIRVHMPSSE
jgi:hypothetical protein